MKDENKKKKKKRGRPTIYDPDYHDKKAFKLFSCGYNNALVAVEFGICPRTLDYWIANHESFKEYVLRGRAAENAEDELRLHKLAHGFYKKVQKPFIVKGEVQIVEYLEYFPPSFPSLRFKMVNKQPEKYRDKPQETETEENTKPVAINIKVVKNDD